VSGAETACVAEPHDQDTVILTPVVLWGMTDTLSCPECGTDVDSADDLDTGEELTQVEIEADGSIDLFEKRDLFLCSDCRNPLGVSRS
jgi:hypothetical protein